MRKLVLYSLLLLVGATQVACMGGASSSTNAVTTLFGLESSILEVTTGKVLFAKPWDSSKDGGHNVRMGIQFLKDGAETSLIVHSDNSLNNGLKIQFQRSGKRLVAKLYRTANASPEDLSVMYTDVDATEPIIIELDIHNHGDIFMSADESLSFEPLEGPNTGWGLELVDSRITFLEIKDPKYKH